MESNLLQSTGCMSVIILMSLPICTDSCRIWMPNFLVLSNYSSVYLPKLPCLNTFSMSDSEYRQYDPTSY